MKRTLTGASGAALRWNRAPGDSGRLYRLLRRCLDFAAAARAAIAFRTDSAQGFS